MTSQTNQTNHKDEDNMTTQTNNTDENNMDNEKSESILTPEVFKIPAFIISFTVAISFVFSSGLLSPISYLLRPSNNYALFNVEGVTVIRDGETVDMQFHLINNDRKISVNEAIDLGFEKNEDGYFAVPWSHLPASSPGNSWRLQEAVKFPEVTRFEEVVPSFAPKTGE